MLMNHADTFLYTFVVPILPYTIKNTIQIKGHSEHEKMSGHGAFFGLLREVCWGLQTIFPLSGRGR